MKEISRNGTDLYRVDKGELDFFLEFIVFILLVALCINLAFADEVKFINFSEKQATIKYDFGTFKIDSNIKVNEKLLTQMFCSDKIRPERDIGIVFKFDENTSIRTYTTTDGMIGISHRLKF